MKTSSKNILYFCIALSTIIFDQWSKFVVHHYFFYGERLNIIPDFFDLTLVYNPGAAFSFLADAGGWQKYFFLFLAVAISLYLIFNIYKNEFALIGAIGASLVIGGAIGNAIDRLLHGHVIDFILFYYQKYHYPAFNIADSAIFLGVFLLLLDAFKKKPEKA